jgi:hypothetical protein
VTDRTADAIGAPIAGHFGPVPAGVTLAETTFATAWNVQGDLARAPLAAETRRLFGLTLPEVANTTRGATRSPRFGWDRRRGCSSQPMNPR